MSSTYPPNKPTRSSSGDRSPRERKTSTKAKVILDIEYNLPPTKYNKIEIEKILAITCHLLQRDNLLSWSDIKINNYKYKIDLNPRYKKYNNASDRPKHNKNKEK